jgi:hypothetical protein
MGFTDIVRAAAPSIWTPNEAPNELPPSLRNIDEDLARYAPQPAMNGGDLAEKKYGDEGSSFSVYRDKDGGGVRGAKAHYGHESETVDANGTKLKTGGPSGDAAVGRWEDEEGKEHKGFKVGGNVGHAKIEKEMAGNTFDFELEGPGGEAGLDVEESKIDAEMGGGKGLKGDPKASFGVNLLKAKAGFASHDKKSDHDRGMHLGVKIGKELGEESEAFPVHFGRTDKDHDGNPEYSIGGEIPIFPGVTVTADYETETPVSDIVSSDLLGPLGWGINFGMHMFGAGDFSPGTLLHDGVTALGDFILGGDDEASPLQMAQLHRSAEQRIEEQVKAGVPRESAELTASMMDPWLDDARSADKAAQTMYEQNLKAGMDPETAERVAGQLNPGWQELRQLDRASQAMYDAQIMSGASPELAAKMAGAFNDGWKPPAPAAKPAAAGAPAPPMSGPMCRVNDDHPFWPFAD